MCFSVIFKAVLILALLTLQSDPAFAGTWLNTVLASLHSQSLDQSRPDLQSILAEFQGHLFPMDVRGDESYASFEIQGRDQVCFEFKVELGSQGKKGYVSWINTEVPGCPLPPVQKGTFLLKLVDWISQHADLSEVRLEDKAKIRCKLNEQPTELAFLRILQKGQSWYGSHGYFPEQKLRIEYEKSVEKLNDFSLLQFKQEFPEFRNEALKFASRKSRNFQAKLATKTLEEKSEELEDWISTFESTYGKDRKLREFLSWVWDEDCSAFNPIARLIFPKIEWPFAGRFGWLQSIRTIEKNGIHLVKQFH